MGNPNFEAMGRVHRRKPLVRSHSTGSNIEATDRLMKAAGARFVGAHMSSSALSFVTQWRHRSGDHLKLAIGGKGNTSQRIFSIGKLVIPSCWFTPQGILLLFLHFLFANSVFATDESVLQRVRSSLNIEQIVDYAIAKGHSAKFNVDEPITINIDLNVAGMGRDDVQSWQLELLRAFSTVNAYLDLRINLNADRSIKYSPQVPYDPFYGQNELSSAQTINVFADEHALSLGKTGQIVVHDIDKLRGLPDSEGCYVEYRLSKPLINIVTDRRLNPLGCIYGAVLRSLGLTDPFGGYRQTFLSESLPGFRLNAEMAAAYAIRECRSIVGKEDQLEKCLRGVLENGK